MFNVDSKRRNAQRLGEYLRSLRRQKGWTQSRAGQAVGVDTVTVRRWELGLFSPSNNRIDRVAKAYGVEVSELIDASKALQDNDSIAYLPIIGYLEAGGNPEPDTGDMGTITLPSDMVRGHSDDFCLRVSGDRLVPDGIHDDDVLLICPDQLPSMGSLCVINMGSSLRRIHLHLPGKPPREDGYWGVHRRGDKP